MIQVTVEQKKRGNVMNPTTSVNKGLKVLLTGVFAAVCISASASLPFVEDFEALDLGPLSGQHDWVVLHGETADVQAGIVRSGFKALEIEAASIVRPMSSDANLLWMRFFVRLEDAPGDVPLVGEDTSLAFYINPDLEVVVYDGPETPVLTGHVVPIETWVQFDVFADYDNGRWLLGMDGSTIAYNLAFYDDDLRQLDGIYFESGGVMTYLDDITMDGDEPAFARDLDADGDGLPDWWEQRFYNGITVADPNAQSAADISLLDTYVSGLDPLDPAARFLMSIDPADRGLQWQRQPGRLYDIYWTESLMAVAGWELIVENHPGSEFTDTDPDRTAEPAAFYKLRVRTP